MMIECKYYDINLARTEQMEKEIAEEKAALTEKKSYDNKRNLMRDIKKLSEEVRNTKENTRRFPMPGK